MSGNTNSSKGRGITLMILSSLCACTGQLFWKIATGEESIMMLMGGFALYGCGALLMLTAYKYGSLSILQPILGLNYLICLVMGYFFLGEQVTCTHVGGCLLIITGVYLITIGE